MGYNTKQKEQITALLRSANGVHLTADDIVSKLSESGISVGKSTVYRQLEKLIEQGIVRRFFVEEGVSACYQFVGENAGCTEHYHLKCSVCGKLLHVECEYLDKVASHIFEHHGFVISNEKTVLYGVCENCRQELS